MGQSDLSIQSLITKFADDASGGGPVAEIKKCWNILWATGPDFGYYTNGKICWIITKLDREIIVKAAFKETAINVTVQGQRHLGAVIGSREYVEEYVNDKVTNWISKITKLAEFTDSNWSILCGIHLWIKPSMDLFPESSARHSRLECNVVISSIPSLPLQIGSGANWTETNWHFRPIWEDWGWKTPLVMLI